MAGFDEALFIALDLGWQPVGARLCANHGKDGRRLYRPPLVRLRVLQLHDFKNFPAHHFPDLGVRQNFDVLLGLHAAGEIARHALGKTFAADHQQHFRRAFGEKHRGLPRRVAAAGDDHGRAAADLSFSRRGRVVNAGALELLAPLGIQTMVIRARRDDDALGTKDRVAPLGLQDRAVLALDECEPERLRGHGKLRAETIGLKLRAVCQFAAADAGGEAEKVLDQRRSSGLSARRIAFQDDGLQPFGRGVNRGAETGWTRADDGEVAGDFTLLLARRRPEQPGNARDFAQRRAPQRQAVGCDQRRQVATREVQPLAQRPPIFSFKSNQPVRNVILVEEIVELAAFARAVLRDDAQPRKLLVPLQSAPPHDESAHDHFAHTRQFCERLSQPCGGHFQNLAFIRFASRACQCRCAGEHPHLADKIALVGRSEDLLLLVARLEYFHLAVQNDDEGDIALSCFEDQFASWHFPARAERLQHCELPIVEFCMSDALCVAVKLLISLVRGHGWGCKALE